VNPALVFLVRRSFVNAVRSRVLRLRQPRYFVPFLLGLAYFALVFGPWNRDDPGVGAATPASDRSWALPLEWGGVLVVLLLASSSWLLPAKGPPITFLEPEVTFLFPAPLPRRDLIRYKVLDLQKYLLPSTAFFGFMIGFRTGATAGVRLFLGMFLCLNLLTLHQIGSRLTRASLLEHGSAGWKRQGAVLAVLATVAAVVCFAAPPFPRPADGGKAFAAAVVDWLERLGESPAGWALYPLRLPGRLFAATDLPAFLLRAVPVAGLLGALYLWVQRCDAAFEEAAADHAQVLARRVEAARKGRIGFSGEERKSAKRSPFRLAPLGPPEAAFVWKGATELLRHIPLRLVILLVVSGFVAMPIALGGARGGNDPRAADWSHALSLLVTAGLGTVAGFLALAGSTALGSNLRTDLELVETLKTLPVTGARLVRSYLASTVAPLAAAQAVLVVGMAMAFPQSAKGPEITAAWRISGAICGILLLPMVTAVSALVDASLALMFPAWIRPGQAQAQGGMEGMGIGILWMLGKVLALGIGVGIPAAAGAVVVLGAGLLRMPALLPGAAIAGALLAASLILLEVVVACGALGRRFEDMDPAQEGILS